MGLPRWPEPPKQSLSELFDQLQSQQNEHMRRMVEKQLIANHFPPPQNALGNHLTATEVLANQSMANARIQGQFHRPAELQPSDRWGATNDTFAEAVAWAKLLQVKVSVPTSMSQRFIIEFNGMHLNMELCSPAELITHLQAIRAAWPLQEKTP